MPASGGALMARLTAGLTAGLAAGPAAGIMAGLAASRGGGLSGLLAGAAGAGRAPLGLPRDAVLRARRLPGRALRCCAGGSNSAMTTNRLCFPAKGMPGRYLTDSLALPRLWSKGGAGRPPASLDSRPCRAYLRASAAPSSNGKTTDSDSVYRGSNPRGASISGKLIGVNQSLTSGRQISSPHCSQHLLLDLGVCRHMLTDSRFLPRS